LLLALAIVSAFFPRVLVYPVLVLFVWLAVALLFGVFKLHHKERKAKRKAGKAMRRKRV
jgi:predicted membrane protein